MEKKKVYILNFGAKLSDEILKNIEEQYNAEVEHVMTPVNVNLQKSIYPQIVSLINKIEKYLEIGAPIIVNTCGLPVAAMMIIVELHSRMGKFPYLIETGRVKTEGFFDNDFKLKRIYDLNLESEITKKKLKENYDNSERKEET